MQQTIRENPAVRERVLAEALRLFTARGYAATTVREIVAAAGVTKPVLYYYFGSKEGLYLELMEGISRAFARRIGELQQSHGSIRQRLLAFFTGMHEGVRENLPTVRLAYAIYFGPPQGAPFIDFNRFFDTTLELVTALIDEGVSSGELLPVDRQSLAWVLIGCHNTFIEEQLCRTPPRVGIDELLCAINLILDGVAAPPTISAIKETL